MAKQSPIPDELSKPFWDACNEGRLVMQTCTACDRMQYPPDQTCYQCGSKDNLEWKEVSGRGKIHGYAVMHDCRIRTLQEDQPFNLAIVEKACASGASAEARRWTSTRLTSAFTGQTPYRRAAATSAQDVPASGCTPTAYSSSRDEPAHARSPA